MASASMLSAANPAVAKVALGQQSTLGKSTFTGAAVPAPCMRTSRRSHGRVCMSASKDEPKETSAPLRKGLAAGLLAATIATSAGPAYSGEILPVPGQRWGQVAQKVDKANKSKQKEFTPAKDSLNKNNSLVDATKGKIKQLTPGWVKKNKDNGFARTNVSFTEAPPLTYVGLDTKGTPADPETVKDDAIGGVTDPASIPGRIKERAGTIASKVGQLTPNLPSAGDILPGSKGLKDVAPDLVEGSSEKIQQRSAPSFGSSNPGKNVNFLSAPPLTYVAFDTKGTPADPATVKADAIGGVTDPASIPGRIKERAGTIASKVPSPSLPKVDNLIPGDKGIKDVAPDIVEGSSNKIPQRNRASFGTYKSNEFSRANVSFTQAPALTYVGLDTKGTPADLATVKDDAIGGVTDPASIPGRIKERAGTIASKLPNAPSLPNVDQILPGSKGIKDVAPDIVEGSSEKIQQRSAPGLGSGPDLNRSNVAFSSAPTLRYVVDTKGTPADPETVKDDAIGGVTDPASIPGRIKERAGTIASKVGQLTPDLPKASDILPGNKGAKDIAPDLVEGSSEKIKQRSAQSNVSYESAPTLQYVGFPFFGSADTKGTPADPATVKDDAIGGVTDPASIPGRVKERASTVASKLPDLPSLPKVGSPDTKGTPADPATVKDDAIGGVTDPASIPGRIKERAETIASKLPSLPSLPKVGGNPDTKGTPADPATVKDDAIGGVTDPASIPGRVKERANTVASKLPDLPSLPKAGNPDTKGTPADPATVKADAIGGVTDPASIPGRVQERAGTIASKLPDLPSLPNAPSLPNPSDLLPGGKGLKDVAPDIVEGSSEKIQQRSAPSYGSTGPDLNRANISETSAPTLRFVGVDTKGTPADPETVKEDAIGGVTDPASIPGRIKERAGTIASKVGQLTPDLPSASDILPGSKGLKDVAPDLVEGSSEKIQQRSAPSFGSSNPGKNVSFSSAPALTFVGLDTKGTPADPATVKDDAIGGVTDPASIPGRVKERAGTIASKLPDLPNAPSLPNVDQILPGSKGIKDVAPDLVEGSSQKVQQRSAPSYGSNGPDFNRTNVSYSSAPAFQFVGLDTKGTPADPETVKDDAIGGVTDPASIPGRIKERAQTIASKLPDLPSLPKAPKGDDVIPGNKGVKDIAPDLVEGSSQKIPQRSAGQ